MGTYCQGKFVILGLKVVFSFNSGVRIDPTELMVLTYSNALQVSNVDEHHYGLCHCTLS